MYKLYKTTTGQDAAIKTNKDGSTISFLFDESNTDYQAYLKWLEESPDNIPHSADGTTNLTPLNREAE